MFRHIVPPSPMYSSGAYSLLSFAIMWDPAYIACVRVGQGVALGIIV